jgi:hypothetical protein
MEISSEETLQIGGTTCSIVKHGQQIQSHLSFLIGKSCERADMTGRNIHNRDDVIEEIVETEGLALLNIHEKFNGDMK